MSTETLTWADFMLARIAEDEAVARDCVYPVHGGAWEHVGDGRVVVRGFEHAAGMLVAHTGPIHFAAHIARHDPARVLAECEAKRRIVERLSRLTWQPDLDFIRRTLALPYADHPDYRAEWRP